MCLMNTLLILLPMDIPLMYKKANWKSPFGIEGYRINNPEYLDPRKEMILRQMEENKKNRKGRFKISKITKPCFVDERVNPIKFVPGPGTYQMERSITSPALTKLVPKIDLTLKKNTYIDQIIHNDKRFVRPAVGQYDLAKSVS